MEILSPPESKVFQCDLCDGRGNFVLPAAQSAVSSVAMIIPTKLTRPFLNTV